MRVLGEHHEGHEQQGFDRSSNISSTGCFRGCHVVRRVRKNEETGMGWWTSQHSSRAGERQAAFPPLSEGPAAMHRRRRQALESHAVVVCPSSSGDRHSTQTLPLSTPEQDQGTPAILKVWANGLQPDNQPKEKGDELAKCVLLTPRVTIQTNPTGQSVLKNPPAPAPAQPLPLSHLFHDPMQRTRPEQDMLGETARKVGVV